MGNTCRIFCCNIKAAVNDFNNLTRVTQFSLTHINYTNWDVVQKLRIWKDRILVALNAAWVKSHQSMCRTKEARLNIIVYHLVNMKNSKWGPGPRAFVCQYYPTLGPS